MTGEPEETMDERPFLRVVRGAPTAEELAALVAAVAAARGAAPAAAPPHRRSWWADRTRLVRRPHAPGPGAWRASAFPH